MGDCDNPMEYMNVSPEDFVRYIRKQFQYREITQAILQQRLIRMTATERKLTVSEQAIQMEADQFRHAHNLENAADTQAWLDREQVDAALWEESINDQLIATKLSEHLFAADIERVFWDHRLTYDRVVLYQIIVSYPPIATELFYQITEGEISFYEAAHLYDVDLRRQQRCGFEGVLERRQLDPVMAPAIFGAHPQQVTAPIASPAGNHLFWIEEFIPAELTPAIRQEIMQQMFQTWLHNELMYQRHA